jgi:very-short-patch-repair endonuclease
MAFAEFLDAWGLPQAIRQFDLPWRSPKHGRVDFAYPRLRVIIELDGRAWHGMLEQFDADRMRDNLAQIAGWTVIRITYRMLMDRPGEVRDLIVRALGLSAA